MANITVTERAVAHIKALFDRKEVPNAALRLKVVGGGCSGLSYQLEPETEVSPMDHSFQTNGLLVVVDLRSALYLEGLDIDYSDDLMDAGFKFRNPNAKHSCGCGESFGV